MKHAVPILRTILLTAAFLVELCAATVRGASPLTGRFSRVPVGESSIIPAYALAQDSLGFVWIGTDSGLYRHDGIRGQHFGREADNPSCICNEHINVLDYDFASGFLHIGTDRGFCTYDNAGGFVQDTSCQGGAAVRGRGVDWYHGRSFPSLRDRRNPCCPPGNSCRELMRHRRQTLLRKLWLRVASRL